MLKLDSENLDQIEFRSERQVLGLINEIAAALPAVSVAVGVINLALRLRDDIKKGETDREVDLQKFRTLLETELAREGVVGYEIVSLSDFKNFLKQDGGQCSVTIRLSDANTIAISAELLHNGP